MNSRVRAAGMAGGQDGIFTPPVVAIDLSSPLRAIDSEQGRP
jgi:hypothetical protein